MQWSDEVSEADWWIDRLQAFSDHVVGSMVPDGFDAITRVFHPIYLDSDTDVATGTWADRAEVNGRVAHAEMQLGAISTAAGVDDKQLSSPDASMNLPMELALSIKRVIRRETSDWERCWFGHSAIRGEVNDAVPENVRAAGKRSRPYFLMNGSLADLEIAAGMSAGDSWWGGDVPELWWPQDRSWFLVREIDFCWTYIAGNVQLIEAIEADHAIETFRSGYEHKGTFDADRINV